MTNPVRSLSDLAKLAGLSAATVSRALSGHWSVSEQTRLRVQQLADEHRYAPNQLARNLRLRRTQTIGLLLPLGHEIGQPLTDPFFFAMMGYIADGLLTRGYELNLSRVIPTDERWLDRVVDSGRIDGLILIGQSDQSAAIDRVAQRYLPLVAWGADLPHKHHLTVGSDNLTGGRLAARHLIERGRKRLLFLGNSEAPEFAHRLAGLREVAEPAGAGVTVVNTPMTFEGAEAGLAAYLAGHAAPDGIFAASDVAAAGALRALAGAGLRVPEDVALIGYDDLPLAAQTDPGLTTIRQDLAHGAKLLVEILFARIEGRPTQSRLLPTELIVRGSTGG